MAGEKTQETFAARWSRLKRSPPAERLSDGPTRPEVKRGEPICLVAPEQVDTDFDFASFLRSDAPAELRAAVLRRLWWSCPELFAPDGLDVYCEDYNAPALSLAGEVERGATVVARAVAAVGETSAEAQSEPAPQPEKS